jgi:beta-phosphoglucomutase-like phosphatase (HAD superfamily)
MKLIIFDLDQTLVDFISVHDEITKRLFKGFFNIDAKLTEIDFAGKNLNDNFRELARLPVCKLERLQQGLESYRPVLNLFR